MADPKKKWAGRSPAPVNETTEDKLKRLASIRVSKALKAIALIGNLKSYKPTAEQTGQILDALVRQIESVRDQLKGGVRATGGFKL